METRAPSTWAPLGSTRVPLMLPVICWSDDMRLEDCGPGAPGSSMSTGANVAICWIVFSPGVIGLEEEVASDRRGSVCACAYVLSIEHSRMVRRRWPGFRKPCILATFPIVDVHAGSLTGSKV